MAPETNLRFPWYERTERSPEVDPGFEGVVIRPAIDLATKELLPVFGAVQFRAESIRKLGIDDLHPLRAVVVGAAIHYTGDCYVGNAVHGAPLFPREESDVVTEYFAVNLLEATGAPFFDHGFVFASAGSFVTAPVEVVIRTR